MDTMEALMLLNDYTEHWYGLGPLADSLAGDKRKVRTALRAARKAGENVDQIERALGL